MSLQKIIPLIHPGEVLLEEFLRPMGLSQSRLALSLRVPLQRVHDIVRGRRGVTVDTAARLARFFGTSPDFWLNLQTHYDLELAEDDGLLAQVRRDVTPLRAG